MIKPLPEEFNGRLGTVDLANRHIQIVHEDDHTFTHWWSKNTLSTTVQLAHYRILRLISAGLSREVDNIGLIYILIQGVEEEILPKATSRLV